MTRTGDTRAMVRRSPDAFREAERAVHGGLVRTIGADGKPVYSKRSMPRDVPGALAEARARLRMAEEDLLPPSKAELMTWLTLLAAVTAKAPGPDQLDAVLDTFVDLLIFLPRVCFTAESRVAAARFSSKSFWPAAAELANYLDPLGAPARERVRKHRQTVQELEGEQRARLAASAAPAKPTAAMVAADLDAYAKQPADTGRLVMVRTYRNRLEQAAPELVAKFADRFAALLAPVPAPAKPAPQVASIPGRPFDPARRAHDPLVQAALAARQAGPTDAELRAMAAERAALVEA